MEKIIPIETNDDMFKVNGTQNIKLYGYPFYFAIIFTYSYLINKLTGCSMIITPISWFIDMMIFYAWHVQAHHKIKWIPFNEACHNWHNLHHQRFYPSKYFYGSDKAIEWIKNYKNEYYLITHALPLGELKPIESIQNESFGILLSIIVNLIKYYIFGWKLQVIIACIIQGLLMDFVGNYLHLSFHVYNHWLNKHDTYKELKYLHYEHHKSDTKRNYAIFFFGLDKLFETYFRTYEKKN